MSQSAANELWQKLSGVRRKVVDESRLSRGKINLLSRDRSRLETRKLINIEMRDYTFRNLCNAKFTNCKIWDLSFARSFQKVVKFRTHLDAVVACSHSTILNLHIGGWVCKFAFCIRTWTFITLKLPAHFQLEPSRIFSIQQIRHANHCSHKCD